MKTIYNVVGAVLGIQFAITTKQYDSIDFKLYYEALPSEKQFRR